MNNENKKNDYEVGYGKPPKHTRFKPGQSGNPKGRPTRQPLELGALLREKMDERVRVTLAGKPVWRTRSEIFAEATIAAAVKGNSADRRFLHEMLKSTADDKEEVVSEDALDALEDYFRRMKEDA